MKQVLKAAGSVAAFVAIFAVHPIVAHADVTVTQLLTMQSPEAASTLPGVQMLRTIEYIKTGVQRTDTSRGINAPIHSSSIFDSKRHRRIIINWADHTYFTDTWKPVESREDNSGLLSNSLKATNNYKMICGYRARQYNEVMSGSMLHGAKVVSSEWIAKDLPEDIRSDSFGMPSTWNNVKGMPLESNTETGNSAVTLRTLGIDKGRIPDSVFTTIPKGFKRVPHFADVLNL